MARIITTKNLKKISENIKKTLDLEDALGTAKDKLLVSNKGTYSQEPKEGPEETVSYIEYNIPMMEDEKYFYNDDSKDKKLNIVLSNFTVKGTYGKVLPGPRGYVGPQSAFNSIVFDSTTNKLTIKNLGNNAIDGFDAEAH